MVITFIGMSGCGKSYWSERIAKEKDFQRFCCDDLIEEKLSIELKALGYSGINDMAKWMGMPWSKQFKENEQKYLNSEIEVMQDLIEKLKSNTVGGNAGKAVVIDTTGSIIYTGKAILESLHRFSRIVYLEANKES